MSHKATPPVTRRDALCRMGGGFGMMAFASLVGESLAAAASLSPQSGKGTEGAYTPDHPARDCVLPEDGSALAPLGLSPLFEHARSHVARVPEPQ